MDADSTNKWLTLTAKLFHTPSTNSDKAPNCLAMSCINSIFFRGSGFAKVGKRRFRKKRTFLARVAEKYLPCSTSYNSRVVCT